MAVEDHLRPERRVPGHLDHHVPERRVNDVEAVVADILPLLLQVRDHPAPGPVHLPHRGGCLRGQDQEHPHRDRMGLQVLLGDQVLTLPGLAVDQRDPVRGRPRLDPAGEAAREPHQVRVVQLIVAAPVQPPPPAPEPARVVPHGEVGVQHDPVHAVIAAGQQIPIPLAEVIGHPPKVPGSSRPVSRTARRATPSGRSPGRSVGHLRCHDFDTCPEFGGRRSVEDARSTTLQAVS